MKDFDILGDTPIHFIAESWIRRLIILGIDLLVDLSTGEGTDVPPKMSQLLTISQSV